MPALPDEWKDGDVKGLKARGDFEISMKWENHHLLSASVASLNGGKCTVRTNAPVKIAGIKATAQKTANGYVVSFNTEKGKVYAIQ